MKVILLGVKTQNGFASIPGESGTAELTSVALPKTYDPGFYEAKIETSAVAGRTQRCRILFKLPLDRQTRIHCEEGRFLPLLKIRENLAKDSVDGLRFKN